jgi:hypothetical protein
MFGVSKLCCGICWDLFKVVRKETSAPAISVSRRHSLFCMVHLPAWLPKKILVTMIELYRSYIRRELEILMADL